jgi:hypothetical protein
MKWFEVTYRRNSNAKVKTVKVKADDVETARVSTKRMLALSGSPRAEILRVRELVN